MDKFESLCSADNWFVIYNPGEDEMDFVPLACWALVSGREEVIGLVAGTTVVHRCDLTDIPWEYWHFDGTEDVLREIKAGEKAWENKN